MANGTHLNYIGEVKIKTGKATYSNYNEGKIDLFKLFSRMLTTGIVKDEETPHFINIIDIVNNNQEILNQDLNLTRQYKEESGYPKAVFTSSILYSNLADQVGSYLNNYQLVLKDGTSERKVLASINLAAEVLQQITTGRQALIEWSLYVTNKGE